MNEDNRPRIVYTIPYYDYLAAQGLKRVFKFLVGVTIVTNVFLVTLYLISLAVPEPILNRMMGKTPEQARIEAHNDAVMKEHDKRENLRIKQEKAMAHQRQQDYYAANKAKYYPNGLPGTNGTPF
jgi:hypothetical protein